MSRLYVAPDGYGDPTIWLDTDTDGQRDEVVMVRTGANAAGFDALAVLVGNRDRAIRAEIDRDHAWEVAAQRRGEARRYYVAWQVARMRARTWKRAALDEVTA